MSDVVELWENPGPARGLIAGWNQWADAGKVSSGLPAEMVSMTKAREIGSMSNDGFYLFQIPAGHHLMRPVVKLDDGHVESLSEHRNAFYYAENDDSGFYIFEGDEPHVNEAAYAEAFLDAVEALGIQRIVILAGVYGAVPFEKDRQVTCAYSLPRLKEELSHLSVQFSDYEGGSTIGTYMVAKAEERDIETVALFAIVPSYDFSQKSLSVQPIVIGEDHKAWYELLLRVDHMLELSLDLSDLASKSEELVQTWQAKLDELEDSMPQLHIKDYLDKLRNDFEEHPYVPLDDVWIEGLKDVFGDQEEADGE